MAEYKIVDIGCVLSVLHIHNHHAPSYDFYSVCQINDYLLLLKKQSLHQDSESATLNI